MRCTIFFHNPNLGVQQGSFQKYVRSGDGKYGHITSLEYYGNHTKGVHVLCVRLLFDIFIRTKDIFNLINDIWN